MATEHEMADLLEVLTNNRDDKSRLRLLKAWWVWGPCGRAGEVGISGAVIIRWVQNTACSENPATPAG